MTADDLTASAKAGRWRIALETASNCDLQGHGQKNK